MDNTQPHDWNSFVAFLQNHDETGLLSLLYSYAAEEKGHSFDDLPEVIENITDICHLQLSQEDQDNIWATAPLFFAE